MDLQEERPRGGRPTSYSQAILELAIEYRDNLPKDEVIHSIEGLADYIGISRTTIYDWKSQEDKKEFSYIVEEILQKQGKSLLNNGLNGKFNQSITKVILTKHNYREGIEHTGNEGGAISLNIEDKKKIDNALDLLCKTSST